jgi:hypothetical protein
MAFTANVTLLRGILHPLCCPRGSLAAQRQHRAQVRSERQDLQDHRLQRRDPFRPDKVQGTDQMER